MNIFLQIFSKSFFRIVPLLTLQLFLFLLSFCSQIEHYVMVKPHGGQTNLDIDVTHTLSNFQSFLCPILSLDSHKFIHFTFSLQKCGLLPTHWHLHLLQIEKSFQPLNVANTIRHTMSKILMVLECTLYIQGKIS